MSLWIRISFLAFVGAFLISCLFIFNNEHPGGWQFLDWNWSRPNRHSPGSNVRGSGNNVSCALYPPQKSDFLPAECSDGTKTTQSDSSSSKNYTLIPYVFKPLPLGSIKPLGWLGDQMELMANGLPGHEHDFYRIVRDNPWLGGEHEYSLLYEAFPYWFNGLVPLAYGVDDERLKIQVLGAAEYIISHQQRDGWLGPETDSRGRNFWARYPVFLGLAQLVEAEPHLALPGTVIPAMHRFVNLMHSMLANDYQGYVRHPDDWFDEQWGRSRAADMIVALQWLYENYPNNNTDRILDCMKYLNDKAYDWAYWFSEGVFIKDDLDTVPVGLTNRLFPYEHGVNAGQGLKAGAAIRRLTHNDTLLQSTRNGVNWTFLYHGAPSGGIIADEREAGLSPSRGVELCSVVETMFSLSYLYQTLGDKDFADRCELAAYNALPVMVMPEWWAHQYVAQTNQPISHELTNSPFWNVGPRGQTFGMEPNYPCCTVNFPQGYAKFLSASFVKSGRIGLAHALLGPAKVTTTTDSGVNVSITCETNYPFNHVLYYTIQSDSSFSFSVRVPSWAILNATNVSLNGGPEVSVLPNPTTGMQNLNLGPGTNIVIYKLAAEIRVEHRANDTVAIHHGALLYAVPVGLNITAHRPRHYPSAPDRAHDYTITPTTPWPLAIDTSTLRFYSYPNRDDKQLPNPIWTYNAPPVTIAVMACEIKWELVGGSVTNPPQIGERNCTSRAFEVGLTPYGAAKLHMAELPTVDLSGGGGAEIDLESGDLAQGSGEL